jgi:CubicO group peptidase (beta-lactamase class C family)
VIRDDRVRETWRVPGACDPRFDLVEEAFEANLLAGLEAGASCAVVVDGRLVVDLSGG